MSEHDDKTDREVLLELVAAMQGLNERTTRHSGGISALDARSSNADMSLEKRQADEILKRQQLERDIAETRAMQTTQTEMLGQILKILSNPLVKVVAAAVGTAILTYLAKGIQ